MILILSPKTIEETMIAIGKKEQDPDIEIVVSVDLIADICTRIIRLGKEEIADA